MKSLLFQLRYIIVLSMVLTLSAFCGLQMTVYPFAIALACALISANHRFYIVAPLSFIIFLVIGKFNLYLVFSLIFTFIVFGIIQLILKKGFYIKVWVQSALFILSQSVFLYFQVFELDCGINALLYIVCSTLCFYTFRRFFVSFENQSFLFRFSSIDLACLCFLVSVLAGGLSAISIPYVSLYHLIGVFTILVLMKIGNAGNLLIYSLMYGLGQVITFANLSYVAIFTLIGITAYYLKSKYSLYSIFGILILESVLGMYFNCIPNFTYITLLETLIASIVFLCIPKKFLQSLRVYFVDENKEYGIRDIANRNRSLLKNKLLDLSNVFFEMDLVFKKMLKGVMPIEDAKNMLVEETIDKICFSCKEKLRCARKANGIQKEIEKLMNIAFEKGKVSLLDVSSSMANSCLKTSQMLNMINKLVNQYKQYTGMIKNLDNSRLLIAEQLHGVAKVIKSLSLDFEDKMIFDNDLETKILNELECEDIHSCEAIVYNKDEKISSIVIVTKTKTINKEIIEKVVSDCVGVKMSLMEVKPSETSGWSLVRMEQSPMYKIMYGFSSTCKNGNDINGDCHSMISLGENKFLFAISDGMGHGENARKNSELTISAIENFYKAGFENEIVLSSVNKLININQMEDFATLDLCVIDLQSCLVDFIKLGASETFLRHAYSTDIIEGKSLPLGVVDEVHTSIQKSALEDGDIIIMCSDGVEDSFGGTKILYDFINHMEISSPQEMANIINKNAQTRCKGDLKDDITIIVARVFRAYR